MNTDKAVFKGLSGESPRGYLCRTQQTKIVDTTLLVSGENAEEIAEKIFTLIPADFVPKKKDILPLPEKLEQELPEDADFLLVFIYVNELHVISGGSGSVFFTKEGILAEPDPDDSHFGPVTYFTPVILRKDDMVLMCNESFSDRISETEMQIGLCRARSAASWLDDLLAFILDKEGDLAPELFAKTFRLI